MVVLTQEYKEKEFQGDSSGDTGMQHMAMVIIRSRVNTMFIGGTHIT